MACSLAKVHHSQIDVRKPYTRINGRNKFSGRDYDESYVGPFATKYDLPVNGTTAFLTPAFRNRNITLTRKVDLVGRPPALYAAFLQTLDDIYQGKISAQQVLQESIRQLVLEKNENSAKIGALLENRKRILEKRELAAEAIVSLVAHHISLSGASRLPVLVVAAAYRTAEKNLGEHLLPLQAHNAADKQTRALGDLQITLVDDTNVVTVYEMKTRPVTVADIDAILIKIHEHQNIDNYIVIATEFIEQNIKDYAAKQYVHTGGIEIVVLDCLGFLRHFLHLFYRLRTDFLDTYESLVLQESPSAVGQNLKEAFSLIRTAAELANTPDYYESHND